MKYESMEGTQKEQTQGPTSGCFRLLLLSPPLFPEGGPGLDSTHSHVKSRTHPSIPHKVQFKSLHLKAAAELSEPELEFTQAAEQHFVLSEVRMAGATRVQLKPTKHEPSPPNRKDRINTVECVEGVSTRPDTVDRAVGKGEKKRGTTR